MKLSSQDWMNEDKEYIANTYARTPIVLKKGKGATLTDVDGKKYIDFGSGIAVNTFGASDKSYVRAVTKQIKQLTHTSNIYYSMPDIELAKLLKARTGCAKVFFGNSGAEANECAIKAARKYSCDKYGKKRTEIVTLENSFHGRTVTTLSATGQDVFHQHFFPFTPGFSYAPANNLSGTLAKITPDTCAVMMELIQGEGGVNVLDKDYVTAVADYCAQKDILLIFDEVQTGNGRTGSLYFFEQYGVQPDILTTAKGLAGGLPLGACLLFGKTGNVFTVGTHGTTFGGNPVACAGALNVLSRLDKDTLESVKEKGRYLAGRLSLLSADVCGAGLMLGAQVGNAAAAAKKCAENGLLVLTAKTKLRFLPPLNISYAELDKGLAILEKTLKETE